MTTAKLRLGPLVGVALVVGALLLGAVLLSGLVSAETTLGEPDLGVYLADNEVVAGEETTLGFEVQNDAIVRSGPSDERITTARAVTVEVVDEGPFDVKTGELPVGSIRDGEVREAPVRTVVPQDVEPGTYEMDVRVRYGATSRVTDRSDQRLSRSTTETLEIEVVEQPRLSIVNVTTAVQPGTSGDVTLVLENTGTTTGYASKLTLVGGAGVTIGDGTSEEFLGEFAPNETRTATVEAALDESAGEGEKPIEATLTYETRNGTVGVPTNTTGSLLPVATQSFIIDDVADTLAVGYDGEVTGTLTNEGPKPVEDGVLLVEPMTDSLFVEDTRYALPPLDPGEATEFRYPTDVSGQADDGPRQLRFTVEYTDGGRTIESSPISQRVVVDEFGDEFSIAGLETSLEAGTTGDFVLEITNDRPETLSNIDARVYTDAPLSAPGDSAFVSELEPGESAEIDFELAVAGDARTTTYPVELDFEYRTERGQTELSDTYQVPVEVTERTDTDDGGLIPGGIWGILAVVLVAGGAGLYWYRRE